MTPKEHLIECVKLLCSSSGGAESVADQAGISVDNLKQILAGTKLESGNPRGVGPTIQRKLDAAFPGWSMLAARGAQPSKSVAFLAETAAKLNPSQLERLIAAADMLAGPHGDRLTISFSIAPRVEAPTQEPGASQ